jgi:hypothetical protein
MGYCHGWVRVVNAEEHGGTSTFPTVKNSEASALVNVQISFRNLEKFEKRTASPGVKRFTCVEVISVDDWEETAKPVLSMRPSLIRLCTTLLDA